MASIFKRKYNKVVNGKKVKKQSQKYYTRLTDADGILRTIPLYTDKTASMHKALQLVKEVEQAKEGIIDRFKEHRQTPLTEHLKNFKQYLLDKKKVFYRVVTYKPYRLTMSQDLFLNRPILKTE